MPALTIGIYRKTDQENTRFLQFLILLAGDQSHVEQKESQYTVDSLSKGF